MIEKLQNELSIEKSKCSEMRRKLLEDSARHNGHKELEQRILTLEKENDILKQSLEQCIGSCITELKQSDTESRKQSQYENHITELNNQVARLQSELQKERNKYRDLKSKHQNLETLYDNLRHEFEQKEAKSKVEVSKECHRSDHLELAQQLQDMQTERRQLLDEFEDMKQMLKSIEDSIISEQSSEWVWVWFWSKFDKSLPSCQ